MAGLTQARTDFWLYQALPLVLHPNQDIQMSAIKAMNCVLPALLATNYQTDPKWDVLQSQLLDVYVTKIRELFHRKNANWHLIWNICIRLLDVQIPRSASTLNLFLSLVEPALRCHDPKRRAEGYLCWRVSDRKSPSSTITSPMPCAISTSKLTDIFGRICRYCWRFWCGINV